LEELQNILMLVAPRKSKNFHRSNSQKIARVSSMDLDDQEDESETLEYFMEVFSSVKRLAEVYLKLANYSCLFLENFMAKIYCDSSNNRIEKLKEPCVVLFNLNNFFDENKTPMPSLDNKKDTLSALDSICAILDETYGIWYTYIDFLREKYNFLNYFTISQIRYLYKNLNNLIIENDKNPKQACKQAEDTVEFEVISSILFNLTNKLSMEKVLLSYQQAKQLTTEPETNSIKLEKLNFKSDSNETFYQNYKQQWTSFINEQNSLKLIKNKYLSFKQLIILMDLFDKNEKQYSKTPELKRRIPGYLNTRGNPNLISCPARDQIPIVLSMYAYDPEAPLPTNDEILFCDSNTTSEQVENFLRVAFMSNGEKIYTLMNIQELTYENSTKIEKFWLSYKNKTNTFILVLVCCIEKQEQSILASVFSKNRVKPIKLASNDLEDYLFGKLRLAYDPKKSINLTSLDPDSMLVRTFLSQRSGNGKSAYIQNLIEKIPDEKRKNINFEVIRIKSSKLNMDKEIEKLIRIKFEASKNKRNNFPTIYHIDIAYEVFQNVDQYLFSLIVCSYLKHSNGLVWRRNQTNDIYLIEMTPPYFNLDLSRKLNNTNKLQNMNKLVSFHSMLNFLPSIEFRTPLKYFYDIKNDPHNENRLKDTLFSLYYKDPKYQRIAYYLNLVQELKNAKLKSTPKRNNLQTNPNGVVSYTDGTDDTLQEKYDSKNIMNEAECLNMILNHSGLQDPNWHELSNFINFLNSQLDKAEKSNLLTQIKGLKSLCLQLIIIMANGKFQTREYIFLNFKLLFNFLL
jgi:hypothetical protein